jgi:Tfp pilus assembly protein PilF
LSLLLDALKRAEQEKLARGPADASATNQGAAASGRPAPATLGNSSFELQPLGGVGAAGARPDASQQSAQTVFQAKAGAAAEPRSRGMFFATIGAISIVLIAAGAYVWYSVTALTVKPGVATRPRPIGPPAGAPPAGMPAPDAALATAMGAGREPLPPAVLPPFEPQPKPADSQAKPLESQAKPAVAKLSPAEDPISRVLREPGPTAAPVRLDRSTDVPRRVPAEVSAGYESLRQGNMAAARRNYAAAIANDPTNVDAHLGLATAEARSGNRSEAAVEYRRVLDLDSRNSTALAALAALADFSRPEALEAQLRADLMRMPDSPALHYTLGNLLSAQSRWTEAQAEYYEAHRLDPGAADVMYNLAVSLDNVGQVRLAANFYARALEARRNQPSQFDAGAASRRLAEIR